MITTEKKQERLEEAFSNLFAGGTSGTGEEELLRMASKYSMQLNSAQMKCLLYLQFKADYYRVIKKDWLADMIENFMLKYLEYKEFNNSAPFVMKIVEYISLRRFLTEQSFKVDIKK